MRANDLSAQETSALAAYVAALRARFGDQLVDVLLFGSKARGDAHPGSDIDVVVILNDPDSQAVSGARGLGFDILLAHGIFLSIRVMSRQQSQALADMDSMFYRNLMRDGVSLLPEWA